jgi:hypothetical protein
VFQICSSHLKKTGNAIVLQQQCWTYQQKSLLLNIVQRKNADILAKFLYASKLKNKNLDIGYIKMAEQKSFVPKQSFKNAEPEVQTHVIQEQAVAECKESVASVRKVKYCVGFKTKHYIETDKQELLRHLRENELSKRCICELIDCSGTDLLSSIF